MADRYSSDQAAIVDRDNRNMAAAGIPMSTEINDLWTAIDSGTIGITAAGSDVDSLAKGGGTFTQDTATAPANSTLLFAWKASRFHNGKTLVAVAGGSLLLAASATNYIELDRSGVVSANTTGWTSGRMPLWVVITGSGSWVQDNVTSAKALLTLIGPNGVDGSMLSTAAQTKEANAQLGTISATTSFLVFAPNVAAVLAAALFANSTAIAASDTDYWTWSITNLGQAGAGATAMLAATAANTTKATGGAALVAGGNRSLALNGTTANLVTAANDVLQVTITKTGAPANLTLAALRLDFTFQA